MARILSRLNSLIADNFAADSFNLCARPAICSMDSSPDTSNTFLSFPKLCAIWRVSVDLPIPGSPLKSIKLPGSIPSPTTRSNSLIPLEILFLLIFVCTRFTGVCACIFLAVFESFAALPIFITSSSMLFQALQELH